MWGSSRSRVAYGMDLYSHKLSLSLAVNSKTAFPRWVSATDTIFSCADIYATFLWCWHLCYSKGCTECCLCPTASVCVLGGAVLPLSAEGVRVLMFVGLNLVLGQWVLFRNVARGWHIEKFSWRGSWAPFCANRSWVCLKTYKRWMSIC